MAVNLGGVINGSRIFGPGMIAHGEPGLIINTAPSRASPRRPATGL